MPAKVVAFLNQKGGSGKTTSSTNFADGLHRQGKRVLLIDLDPQGSATRWRDQREDAYQHFPVIRMGKSVSADLQRLKHDFDVVVIDGPAIVSELTAAAVKAADVVIIPVQPSPYDVWAADDVVEMVRTRQQLTDGKPRAAFLISRLIHGTKVGGEVEEVLRSRELPVLSTKIVQRVIYAGLVKDGLSVFDLKSTEPARAEFAALTDEVWGFANE